MLRARMIVAMESLFSQQDRQNRTYFPRYYYVLVPLGDGKMNHLSTGDQWNGVLNALKGELRIVRDKQDRLGGTLRQLDEKMTKVEMRIDSHIERIEQKLGRSEERANGIKAGPNVEELLSQFDAKVERRLQGLENKLSEMDRKFEQLFHFLSVKDAKER